MSKNTNLSFLTDYITADITNGRIGINNASPTVAFDVTGVAKFSSSVTATSFNATTQNIFAVDGTERMRIGSDGTKYFGVSNTSRLQINPTGENVYSYTNNYYIWGLFNDSNSLTIESAFAGNIIFRAQAQGTSSSPTTATERMRITSAGRVGIGTTSPQAMLSINNNFNSATAATYANSSLANINAYEASSEAYLRYLDISMGSGDVGSAIRFLTATSNAATVERMRITSIGNVGIGNTGNSSRKLEVTQPTGYSAGIRIVAETGPGDAKIQFFGGGSSQMDIGPSAASPNDLIFGAGGSERMRITSGGNVGIGTTNPVVRLQVDGPVTDFSYAVSINAGSSTANGMVMYLPGNRSSDTTYKAILLGDDSAVRFRVLGNGNVQNTNGSYGTISDISIKENITDATTKLSDILKLKVRNFNFIGETSKQIGFIAQELEQVFPRLIDIDGETKLSHLKVPPFHLANK